MRKPGIYGPYRHREKWRLIVIDEGGGQNYLSYESEKAARAFRLAAEEKLAQENGISVNHAIDLYEKYLQIANRKPRTIETARQHLEMFFGDEGSRALATITPADGKRLYMQLAERTKTDTHRNALGRVKTFCKWAVHEKILAVSPIATLEGIGKRKRRKNQLRIDEARKWLAKAREIADTSEKKGERHGAIAAMLTLLLGVRASEITERRVRDVDDGGRLLWIPDAKTTAGQRVLEIPDLLQPYLKQLIEGRPGDVHLFPASRKVGAHTRQWVFEWVQNICVLADVPKVGAHSMRGLHSSLAVEAGATSHLVIKAMGHDSYVTSERHYIDPNSAVRARMKASLKVLQGGE